MSGRWHTADPERNMVGVESYISQRVWEQRDFIKSESGTGAPALQTDRLTSILLTARLALAITRDSGGGGKFMRDQDRSRDVCAGWQHHRAPRT